MMISLRPWRRIASLGVFPEWMKLTGTSRPTLWRQVKRGDVQLVYVGPTPMVTRAEAVRLGLIND